MLTSSQSPTIYTARENTPPSSPAPLYSFRLPERTLFCLLLHLYTPFILAGDCKGESSSFLSCPFLLHCTARENTSPFSAVPLYSQGDHSSYLFGTFILFILLRTTLLLLLLYLVTPLYCQGEHTSFFACTIISLNTARENFSFFSSTFKLHYTAQANMPPSSPAILYDVL